MTADRLISHLSGGLVAHQGGWDEILWVLVPILVMVGLLRVATKRVRKSADNEATRPPASNARDIGAE
jgi:hypothetical protein